MQLRVTLITEPHGGNDIGKTQAEDARMDKKMTIYTIAEELGVTPTSVSRAFNPNSRLSAAKRKLILEASAKYGFTPNRMASRLSKREITVGVLIYSRFRQFYSELIRGIEDAYEGLKDYKVKCDLRFVDSLEHSALVCNDILDEFARKKYDGVIISDLTSDADIDKINALSEKCGNLVLVNFDSNGIKRLFASIHDIELASRTAAEFISVGLTRSKRKNVVLFTDDITAFTQMKAQNAFCAEAESYGMNVKGIYNVNEFSYRLLKGDKEAASVLLHGTDGVYVSCGNSMAIAAFIKENGLSDKLITVTYDLYPELTEYIRSGVITATVFQNSYMQAKTAFERLCEHILSGTETPSVVYTNFDLVMKNNLGLYERTEL